MDPQRIQKMSESLGFVFTPREEIDNRLARVRASMRKKEIEALLVVQKMDYYYLSGTTQDALLFVPSKDCLTSRSKRTGASQSGVAP